jgi:GMP synthase-like glutamine amidotransferase
MLYCSMNNIPMIGVCRGAQMMCAFAGGFLIQDTNKHNRGDHLMLTTEGEIINTTSAHHQMMYPYNVDHELLAWSHKTRGDWHDGASKRGPDLLQGKEEPEVVYFPDIRGLAIQGHPEWATEHGRYAKYVNDLVRTRLLAEVAV